MVGYPTEYMIKHVVSSKILNKFPKKFEDFTNADNSFVLNLAVVQ